MVCSCMCMQPPPAMSSPRKPIKLTLQNSSLPSRSLSLSSGNKITTPTSTTPSKSNSLGRSTSSGAPPSNGSTSPRGASKPAQLPQGPAYSIAAGGQQNSVVTPSNSLPSPTATSSQHTVLTHKDQAHGHSSSGSGSTVSTATPLSGVPSSAIPTSVSSTDQLQQPQHQVMSSPTQVRKTSVPLYTCYATNYSCINRQTVSVL